MTTADAAELGLVDNQVVSVKIDSAERSLVFGDVVVRVMGFNADPIEKFFRKIKDLQA